MSKTLQRLDNLQQERFDQNSNPEEKENSKDLIFSKLGMVLWLVASISATIFSYHLGVRQGIQSSKNESPRQWLYYFNEMADKKAEAPVPAAAPLAAKIETAPAAAVVEQPVILEAKKTPPEAPKQESGFTIQVVTYRSQNLAEKEVERLKQKGQNAFVVPSGDYYQVCIELFNDRKLAMKKLIQLRTEKYYEIYPGAFVKFLKPAANS